MPTPEEVVHRILRTLEEQLNLDLISSAARRHAAALNYAPVDRLPLVLYLPYEGRDFAPYPYSEAFHHPAKMMVNELLTGFSSIYHLAGLPTDTPLCLRPNLGITLVASCFGAEIELRGEDFPWVRPLQSLESIREISASSTLPGSTHLVERAIEQYEFFTEFLAPYPRCQAALQLTLPDLQGPFDTAELLWGSSIFTALYEEPDLVDAFMHKVAQVMLETYHTLIPYVRHNLPADCQYQHATGVKGKILLRADTTIMISPKMYYQHIRPVDAWLAEQLGGVGIHFCGNGFHQVTPMLSLPLVQSLDFGQAACMDLDAIYALAAPQRVALARLRVPREELCAARVQRRFPTGVNLVAEAASVADAQTIWAQYVADN